MKSSVLLLMAGWLLLAAGGNIAPWHFIKDQRELAGDNWRLVKYPAKNQEYLVEFDVWAARQTLNRIWSRTKPAVREVLNDPSEEMHAVVKKAQEELGETSQ